MTSKDFSIKIGNIELSTRNMPQEGIDFDSLSYDAQKILSVFNTDNDKKHISKEELSKAIMFFSQYDTKSQNGEDSPDGILDYEENNNALKALSQKVAKDYVKVIDQMIKSGKADFVLVSKMISKFFDNNPEFQKYIHDSIPKFKGNSTELLKFFKQCLQNPKINQNMYRYNALNDTARSVAKNKPSLTVSEENSYFAQDKDGIYYYKNPGTHEYEACPDIKLVNGVFQSEKIDDNGQCVKTIYGKNGYPESVIISDKQNNQELTKDEAAQIAGLIKCEDNNYYTYQNKKYGPFFLWDDENNKFVIAQQFSV